MFNGCCLYGLLYLNQAWIQDPVAQDQDQDPDRQDQDQDQDSDAQ